MSKLTDYRITWDFKGHVAGGSSTPGYDFGTPMNTGVAPLHSGTVTYIGEDPKSINPRDGSKAKFINLENKFGKWQYVHFSKITAVVGQYLDCNKDIIGYSGDSGNTSGPHTHVSLIVENKYVDFKNRIDDAYPQPEVPNIPTPEPPKPPIDVSGYRIYNRDDGQVAVYKTEEEAFEYFLNQHEMRVALDGKEITKEFAGRIAELPKVANFWEQKFKGKVDEYNALVDEKEAVEDERDKAKEAEKNANNTNTALKRDVIKPLQEELNKYKEEDKYEYIQILKLPIYLKTLKKPEQKDV